MPSHNYPKNIIEHIDIDLCRLEHKVEALQRAKGGIFPVYDAGHFPTLANGQGFFITDGRFCVYYNGSMYCIPSAGTGIFVEYYPNFDNGSVIGIMSISGRLRTVFAYVPEFSDSTFWELYTYPGMWMPDHSHVTILSREEGPGDLGWTKLNYWWLVSADGKTHTKLTTGLKDERHSDDGDVTYWYWLEANAFNYISSTNRLWVVLKSYPSVAEYLYSDGYLTTDDSATGHGPRLLSGTVVDFWVTETPNVDDAHALVTADDLPNDKRWSNYYNTTSIAPDGSKVAFMTQKIYPLSTWGIRGQNLVLPGNPADGGTFTITIGTYPDGPSSGQTTAPIAWNATAEDILNAVVALSNVDGPNVQGSYPGYAGGPLNTFPSSSVGISVLPQKNLWMEIDSSGLVNAGSFFTPNIYVESMSNYDDAHLYIIDRDGSNLTYVPTNLITYEIAYWHPSSQFVGILTADSAPRHYAKWQHVDANTYDVTVILDFGDTYPGDYSALSNVVFSATGNLLAYVLEDIEHDPPTFAQLWIADIDGSNRRLLYEESPTMAFDDTDLSRLKIGRNFSWSFNDSHIFMTDTRNDATSWLINVATGAMQKIYSPVGEEQIFNPTDFGFS